MGAQPARGPDVASMLTDSADSKASGLANYQGTASKQVEARLLVSQLLACCLDWLLPLCAQMMVVSALLWPISCALGLPGDENVASPIEGLCQS